MFKRLLLCALTGLLVAMLPATPSAAEDMRVRMRAPQMVDEDTARLKGRVTGRDTVVIQRYAAGRQQWVKVRRVPANAEGAFRTRVRATGRAVRYRAVSGGVASAIRTVRAIVVQEQVAPAPRDACGPQPLKADGSRWSCTLAENFSGDTLNRALWQPAGGFLGGTAPARPCFVDDPSVISVQNGTLRLSARQLSEPVHCAGTTEEPTAYIAGGVNTYRKFSQQYGRVEARFKNTATNQPGLQEAFWLWPDDRYNTAIWPAAGEIDIAETYSQYPDLAIPFLHYTANDNGGPRPGLNTAWDCIAKRGEYNTYTLEWTANRIEILVNGRTCLVNTSGDVAFQKPYILALTQLLGTGTNMYDGRAPMPTMTVDYVKVWK